MNNKIIYTAIYGNKDNLHDPKYVQDDVDYICFTEHDFKSDVWEIKRHPSIYNDSCRDAKRFKILPHFYFYWNHYKYSIWIDGNIIQRNNINEIIKKYLDNNNSFAAFNHNYNKLDSRDCIYKEYDAIMKLGKQNGQYKDDPELMKNQIEKYKNKGYPKENGLTTNMILFRRHNNKECIKVMNDWWNEICYNSRRDQLSFNYIAWKNDFNFNYINKDSRDNKWFKQIKHKK